MAVVWASIVGWSNVRIPGSTISGAYALASSDVPTFTKHSSNLAARSSVGTSSDELCRVFELASKGTSADAPSQIHWRLIRAAGKQTLEGHNPTQYYISLVDVTLLSGPHKATADGGMIGPGETHAFPLSGEEIEAAGAKVHYTTVNDYGAFVDGETPVLPSGAALLK